MNLPIKLFFTTKGKNPRALIPSDKITFLKTERDFSFSISSIKTGAMFLLFFFHELCPSTAFLYFLESPIQDLNFKIPSVSNNKIEAFCTPNIFLLEVRATL